MARLRESFARNQELLDELDGSELTREEQRALYEQLDAKLQRKR